MTPKTVPEHDDTTKTRVTLSLDKRLVDAARENAEAEFLSLSAWISRTLAIELRHQRDTQNCPVCNLPVIEIKHNRRHDD